MTQPLPPLPCLALVVRYIPPAAAVIVVKQTEIPAQHFIGDDEVISTKPILFIQIVEA